VKNKKKENKMKRNILLSVAAVVAAMTLANAGGDIAPVYEPVAAPEPTVQYEATPAYIGVGLNRAIYNNQCGTNCTYEDVTYGVTLRAGYEFNQYVGIEARYIGTFWGADELGGQELSHVGLYVKPMMPLDTNFNIYGLLGYGMTTTTTGGNGNLPEVDEDGFSAGLGIEYDLVEEEKGWGLFVDYQRLLIDSNVPDLDVVSAGVTYDF